MSMCISTKPSLLTHTKYDNQGYYLAPLIPRHAKYLLYAALLPNYYPVLKVEGMYFQSMRKTVWILIRWLRQKPADLDLQCFQNIKGITTQDQPGVCCQSLLFTYVRFVRKSGNLVLQGLVSTFFRKPADQNLHCFQILPINGNIIGQGQALINP